VIASGIALSLYLASFVHDEVFYVGDGGLRALLCRQLASGHLVFYLDPPAESWVHELWDRGLYPFEPPFVYERQGNRYMVFPFVFPLLTAPFYALWGFRGLYVVPLLALWATWIRFAVVSRAAGLGDALAAIATATLVFASPLTVYGAVYWEYTLAVCLAFMGLSLLVPLSAPVSKGGVVLGGFLLSLSGLVREELFGLVGLVASLILVSPWLPPARAAGIHRHRARALWSMAAGVCLFLAANWLVYRRPLGLHSILGLEDFPAESRVSFAIDLFRHLGPEFFRYFPVAAFAGTPFLLRALGHRASLAPAAWLWLGLACAYLVGVMAVLPSSGGKQWSPRFLLVLVPITCLLATLALAEGLRSPRRLVRALSVVVFGGLWLIGSERNTLQGSADLRRTYERRAVALSGLRALPSRFIAVSHQFISQQAEALFAEKRLFLTRSGRSLRMVAEALAARGETTFVFLCDPVYTCGPVTEATEAIVLPQGRPPVLRLTKMGAIDRYVLFEGRVLSYQRVEEPPASPAR
jgi:hypothetical protein